jgi:class 3 adenylate cyclase/CHASE2 domain-containing sensor protein
MTRLERKLLLINGLLGTGLTVLVALLDHAGRLEAPERWFYDQRALHCQFFRSPPSDRLVHVDIDENDLEVIQRWPWPRAVLGQVIDEISAAGPSVIALDMRFPEAQPPTYQPRPDGSFQKVDDDAVLAAALRRSGRVLVPVSLMFEDKPPPPPVESAMMQILRGDLELTLEQVAEALRARGFSDLSTGDTFKTQFVSTRRDAMFERISEAMEKSDVNLADLRKQLLPRTDPMVTSSPLLRLLTSQFEKAEKVRPLLRFSRPVHMGMPPLYSAVDEEAPLSMFSREAIASAFVDYIKQDDGKVRAIPLFVRHRDRVFPQMGLTVACIALGVDPNDVRIEPSRVVIPKKGGGEIVVPVSEQKQPGTGRTIGAILDIPYFGTTEWMNMYDFPKHKLPSNHVPVNFVWRIVQTRQAIESNNATADRALNDVIGVFLGEDRAKEYLSKKLDPQDAQSRAEVISQVLEVIGKFLEQFKDPNPSEQDKKEMEELKFHQTGMRSLLNENQRLMVQFRQQRDEVKRRLEGKAVLVGSVAGGLAYDFVPTPLHDKCPGVVVHGVIADSILTGNLLRRSPIWVTRLITILMGLTTTAFVLRLRTNRAAMAGVTLAAIYLLVNGILLFDYFNIIVGVAGPIVAVLVTWVSCQLVEILVEKAERRRITRRFQSYVDPKLVEYVINHPELDVMGGHVREMTVVFTDLAGFTTISETLKEKVIPLLNEYLGMMAAIIRKHRGLVNKFLGDGIMFFYNAPDENPNHAADALATVLDMQEALVGFNQQLENRGLPRINMRAGITTGPMVVGDAGSKDSSDYTVIGDNVNLAARLESANKATDTKVLMTVRTAQMLGDRYLVRPAARLQVKGKSEGVDTCVLVARASEATEQQRRYASLWKQIFDAYVRADFDGCKRALDELESTAGPDKLTQAYRELCEQYLKEPPMNGFDGHIVLHEK